MNKPPTGPEIEPEDVDRLIAKFNRSAEPEKRSELDEGLRAWKEKFQELQRGHAAQERSPERDR
jgi:hypothetical protein